MNKTYKYWSGYHREYRFTDSETTARNQSYQYQKMYYKWITHTYVAQDIPDEIDLSNTDTFHYHEAKGKRHAI